MIIPLAKLFAWLVQYEYLVIFPAVVVEGPIVTVLAGFLASMGLINPVIAYIIIVIADLAGDVIYYSIGHWGRQKWVERWGRYIGLTEDVLKRLDKLFEKHPGKALLFGKISHAIGAPILVASGLANTPFRTFLWFNFLGTIPKSLLFMVIGFYFGMAYNTINKYLNDFVAAGFIIAFLFIIVFWLFNKYMHKFFPKD